jgi:hypothetical protein
MTATSLDRYGAGLVNQEIGRIYEDERRNTYCKADDELSFAFSRDHLERRFSSNAHASGFDARKTLEDEIRLAYERMLAQEMKFAYAQVLALEHMVGCAKELAHQRILALEKMLAHKKLLAHERCWHVNRCWHMQRYWHIKRYWIPND